MYICSVGAELCHADGRTDGRTDMKQIVAFRNFAIRLKTTQEQHLAFYMYEPVEVFGT
jgi:hypothetical protein